MGRNELVDAVTNGDVDLSEIDSNHLPEPLRAASPEEQKAIIERNAETRSNLTREIRKLVDQRNAYLRGRVEEEGGAEDSLDNQIFGAVRSQAEAKGLRYSTDAPAY